METSIEKLVANVKTATTLRDLRDALNSLQDALQDEEGEVEPWNSEWHGKMDDLIDITGLQTVGGEEPASTENIWSWDAESFMGYVNGKYVIESR